MPITNIVFDLEGVLGFYPEAETFEFYKDSLVCIEELIKGYNLYYLTNVLTKSSSYFNQTIAKKFSNFGFSGGLGSNNYNFGKPDERFYKEFLNKYRLSPEECLFIDDKKVNVLVARDIGINSITHTSKGNGLLGQIQELVMKLEG